MISSPEEHNLFLVRIYLDSYFPKEIKLQVDGKTSVKQNTVSLILF